MSEEGQALFCEYDTHKLLGTYASRLEQEIDELDEAEVIGADPGELAVAMASAFSPAIPTLREDEITRDVTESQYDARRNPYAYVRDQSRPFYIKATKVTIFVPFDGDPDFLRCRPSTFSVNPPIAELRRNELVLTWTAPDIKLDEVRAKLDRDLADINSHLATLRKDAEASVKGLSELAQKRIEARRQRLEHARSLEKGLGFPARRKDAPSTYTAPVTRRAVPRRATAQPAKGSSKPEPVFEMAEYDHVLSVISNMVKVMERSPSAFAGMKEEHLRQHFLVQLNSQYEGQATGETFNYGGKTDILVRVADRNIFIAECKFWNGPQSVIGAIDQLLGYATWRDTKLALLIFVKSKEFSDIVKRIGAAAAEHPNVKRALSYANETGFRYILKHKDDKDRELTLTVLAFHVPEAASDEGSAEASKS